MSEDPAAACANCGAVLQGRFCHTCGQQRTHLRPTLRHFLHDAVHELLSVDGKIVRSMKLLLFSPGTLTREFNSGRRASYISPLRLYLIWSVVFFALFAFAADSGEGLRVSYQPSADTETRPELERRIEAGVLKAQQDPRGFGGALVGAIPKAMFLLMPLSAVLLLLLYRKRESRYVPHLYASIHLHAFVFVVFTLAAAASLTRSLLPLGLGWRRTIGIAIGILLLAPLPYYFVALRRIYQESWAATIAKGALVGALYSTILFVTMMGVVVYTVLKL